MSASDRAVTLVHVPKSWGGKNEIMYAPMGLFSVADAISEAGYDAEIVHVGLENMNDRRFSLLRHLSARRPVAVMFDLHWHHQTAAVLGTAYQVKQRFPDVPIVLGGLTASYFHREIVERLHFVDAVVRGDGELHAAALVDALAEGSPASEVPGVAFRSDDGGCAATEMAAGPTTRAPGRGLTNVALMRNHEAYLSTVLYGDFNAAVDHRLGPAFCYNPGRGCAAHCVFCGGAAAAQRLTSGRRGERFYPDEQVMADLDRLTAAGVATLRTSFDPESGRDRTLAWFTRIRERGSSLRMVFDLWSPPTAELIDSFGATFLPGSILVFSPESGSARVRLKTRGFRFSNEDLLAWIAHAGSRDVPVHLFFTAGLPFEGPAELAETESLIAEVRRRTHAQCSVAALELDPGSAMHRHPESFGVTVRLDTLHDFYEAHRGPTRPGFRTATMSEDDIVAAVTRLQRAGL